MKPIEITISREELDNANIEWRDWKKIRTLIEKKAVEKGLDGEYTEGTFYRALERDEWVFTLIPATQPSEEE